MSQTMRQRSGRIDGTASEAVLYRLLRDGHIAPGALESVVQDVIGSKTVYQFSNGWLALYAKDVIARIREAEGA